MTDPSTTTVAPTTTEAPTTSVDPSLAFQAEVGAAYLTVWERAVAALQNPNDPDLEVDALAVRAGAASDGLAARLAQFRSDGRAIRPNRNIPAGVTIEVAAKPVADSPTLATLLVCELDSWALVEVGTGPNGGDTIINDGLATYREQITMQMTGSTWRAIDVVRVGEWTGVTTCPDE